MKRVLLKLGHWLLPAVYLGISRLLLLTCRIRQHGEGHFTEGFASSPFIAASWHYGIFYNLHLMHRLRRENGQEWILMLSASSDADYVAMILEKMRLQTVRGSQRKGGLAALKKMTALMRQGMNAGIIVDGSQGPARKVQAGVILLASMTGAPILPTAWAADRYVAFRSWDRTVLPKPFARLALWYGEPLRIPARLSSGDLEKYRLELEERLNRLYHQAWGEFGIREH
jgi:lysophospholipid acyltransferase (LPLAT)-like uncharacterized protein